MDTPPTAFQRFLAHRWAGLIVLVGLLLPLMLYRCTLARTFWGDEMYSVLMASLPVSELLDVCRADAHPPTYYLMIRGWLLATGALGLEPSIFLVRLPNVFFWLVLCVVSWCGGRRLLGPAGGSALAFLLAGSAHAAYVGGDLRQYSVLFPTMTGCWLILLEQWSRATAIDRPRSNRTESFLWALFAVSAALGLWTQLLSGVFLFLLGLLWVGLAVRMIARGRARDPFVIGGLVANAAAVIAFLPGAAAVPGNMQYVSGTGNWMTPPTWANLATVFTFWLPFGQSGFVQWPADTGKIVWGVLAFLLPVGVGALGLSRRNEPLPSGRVLFAASGIGLAIAFTLTLWTLTRLEIVKVFHGPRYPAIALGVWVAGLCGAVTLAFERLGRRAIVWLALVPFVGASAFGWHFLLARQHWGAPSLLVTADRDLLPPPGTPLYVAPDVLIPYWQATYAEWPMHPLADLAKLPADATNATILDAFVTKDARREGILFWAAKTGAFSRRVRTTDYPDYRRLVSIIELRDVNRAATARIDTMPWIRAVRPNLDGAIAIAVPEMQTLADGWHLPRQGQGEPVTTWTARERAGLRFDGVVPAGDYTLRLRGVNGTEAVRLAVSGEHGVAGTYDRAGRFDFEVPLHLAESHDPLVLTVERETRRDDRRQDKGWQLWEASLWPAKPSVAP